MSLSILLSGVQAAQTDLDTIGNNISNVSTIGFKQSDAQFADIYTGAISGPEGPIVPGDGVETASLAQAFTQGTVQQTGNALDAAVTGNGFFEVQTGTGVAYTRDGQFQLNSNGALVTAAGNQVLGFATSGSSASTATSGGVAGLDVNTSNIAGTPTSAVTLAVNLPSTDAAIDTTATPFSPTNPQSYDESTSTSVYDSLGVSRTLTTYFTQVSGSSGEWQSNYQLTDSTGSVVSSGAGPTLSFNSAGQLTSGSGSISVASLPDGAAPLNIALNYTGSTVSDLAFAVNSVSNDGTAAGQFSGVSIQSNGEVMGQYTNGASKDFGTIALANFANPQGLTPISGNLWVTSPNSGTAISSAPNTGGAGTLQSGAVEGSNVDLSTQLVDLIAAQQAYQANVQGINVEQQDIQRLVTIQ